MTFPIVRWAGSKYFDEGSALLGKDSIVPGGISPSTQSPVGVPDPTRTLRWNLAGQSALVNELIRSDPAEFKGARRIRAKGPQYERSKHQGMYYSLRDPNLRNAVEAKDLLNDFIAEQALDKLFNSSPGSSENSGIQKYTGIG